jgi:hypothetical protein
MLAYRALDDYSEMMHGANYRRITYNARNRPMGYHSTNQGISTVLFVAILSEYGMYICHQSNL